MLRNKTGWVFVFLHFILIISFVFCTLVLGGVTVILILVIDFPVFSLVGALPDLPISDPLLSMLVPSLTLGSILWYIAGVGFDKLFILFNKLLKKKATLYL